MNFGLFFALRLPGIPFKRIRHILNDVQYTSFTIACLKKHVKKLDLENYQGDLEFVYNGIILEDSDKLLDVDVEPLTTIHVFERIIEPETDTFTEECLENAIQIFENLRCYFPPSVDPKPLSPNIFVDVLKKFPGIQSDPVAFSLLLDPMLLLSSFQRDRVHALAEKCPILIHASKNIADAIVNYLEEQILEPSEDSLSGTFSYLSYHRINRFQLSNALSSANPTFQTLTSSSGFTGQPQLYVAELQRMSEMGLTDEHRNLQALILCNGNVEEAINLMLGM